MTHVYPCRVRWSDVDSYGHVNNVKYFEYFQESRLAFLNDMMAGFQPGAQVVARIDVDYFRPILFRPEPFAIHTWVTRVGGSSYDLSAEIRDGDAVLSRGRAVIVTYDLAEQRSKPLEPRQREALEALLGSE